MYVTLITYNKMLVRLVFLLVLLKIFLKSGVGDSAILDAMFEKDNLC